MTPPTIGRAVSRRKVLVGAMLLGLFIAGIVVATDALRYPTPAGGTVTAPDGEEPAFDPRAPIDCPDPLPREGQPRAGDGGQEPLRQVTSNDLYDCPQTFDGSQVRYRGEVVGAVLERNEGAWVQLNDDVYAGDIGPLPAHRDFRGGNAGLGVFVPHDLAAQITHLGGPAAHGDIVEVVGIFHRVDAATGEVAILRATEGTVTPGGPLVRPLLPLRRTVAIAMFIAMLATVVGELVVRRRE